MAFGPNGNLYVVNATATTSSVLRYNGETGAFMGAFVPAGSGGANDFYEMAFGPNGNLFAGDANSGARVNEDDIRGRLSRRFRSRL